MEKQMQGFSLNTNSLVLIIVGLLALSYLGIVKFPGASAQPGQPGASTACEVPLSSAQTLSVGVQNADTGAAVGNTNTIYLNTATGQTNPGGTTTTPGTTYQVLTNSSNFFSALTPVSTSCTATSPQLPLRLDAVDTAVTMSILNNDGLTLNAAAGTNQSLTASSPTTITLRLQPSALNKHLSGPINKFAVVMNHSVNSSLTYWDNSKVAVSFQGQPCSAIGGTYPTVVSSPVWAYACTGDFTGSDTSFYPVSVTLSPAAAYTKTNNQQVQLGVVGYDYFTQVSTNGANVAGSVQQGGWKDDGSATQTMQFKTVYLG